MSADDSQLWKRRIAFRESLEVLKDMSEFGIRKAQDGLWGLFTSAMGGVPKEPIAKLKYCGLKAAKSLLKLKPDVETAAAFMLVSVLDAAHKNVLMVWFSHLILAEKSADEEIVLSHPGPSAREQRRLGRREDCS